MIDDLVCTLWSCLFFYLTSLLVHKILQIHILKISTEQTELKKYFNFPCTGMTCWRRLCCTHSTQNWSGILSPFMQMFLTWGPSTWALASGWPSLCSVSFSSTVCIARQITDYYWSEEIFLSPITRDTRNLDREKTSGQIHLFKSSLFSINII